ncbi:hypothetical protein BJ508DRAFT_341925 [Ascobolus immersus RN42]|uniref:Uncharacterized protein n=1 Tax=Ascobolus immersus RN42 TaxID=1160509 RepID=A0A3N4HJF3_ASCIM|nr:hypothetical protein BJ508DRAFT_341925 [Ascobolus immersus RN42]
MDQQSKCYFVGSPILPTKENRYGIGSGWQKQEAEPQTIDTVVGEKEIKTFHAQQEQCQALLTLPSKLDADWKALTIERLAYNESQFTMQVMGIRLQLKSIFTRPVTGCIPVSRSITLPLELRKMSVLSNAATASPTHSHEETNLSANLSHLEAVHIDIPIPQDAQPSQTHISDDHEQHTTSSSPVISQESESIDDQQPRTRHQLQQTLTRVEEAIRKHFGWIMALGNIVPLQQAYGNPPLPEKEYWCSLSDLPEVLQAVRQQHHMLINRKMEIEAELDELDDDDDEDNEPEESAQLVGGEEVITVSLRISSEDLSRRIHLVSFQTLDILLDRFWDRYNEQIKALLDIRLYLRRYQEAGQSQVPSQIQDFAAYQVGCLHTRNKMFVVLAERMRRSDLPLEQEFMLRGRLMASFDADWVGIVQTTKEIEDLLSFFDFV